MFCQALQFVKLAAQTDALSMFMVLKVQCLKTVCPKKKPLKRLFRVSDLEECETGLTDRY